MSAEFQHVTYAEWLPLVLDSDTMSKYRLTEGTFQYDANLNPTVSNVFSTATFRFGHSQIKQIVKVRYIISRAILGQSKQSRRDLRCLGQSEIYRHCVEMRITCIVLLEQSHINTGLRDVVASTTLIRLSV